MSTTDTSFSLAPHNGFVTVTNPKTGGRRTFRVRTEKWGKDTHRVVGLLTGPRNTADYTNFGFVEADGSVKVWYKKRRETAFVKFARMLADNRRDLYTVQKGVTYRLEGRCRRCNRTLTVPESIESGIGPVCAKK